MGFGKLRPIQGHAAVATCRPSGSGRDNDNTCNRCGMTGHWSRTCPTQKHFVELYQASIKGKGKRVESHSVEDIETNNALVLHTTSTNEVPLAPTEAKSLEISDFFEDNSAPNPEWWKNAQT